MREGGAVVDHGPVAWIARGDCCERGEKHNTNNSAIGHDKTDAVDASSINAPNQMRIPPNSGAGSTLGIGRSNARCTGPAAVPATYGGPRGTRNLGKYKPMSPTRVPKSVWLVQYVMKGPGTPGDDNAGCALAE